MQADIVHELNDALETDYDLDTPWEQILPHETAVKPSWQSEEGSTEPAIPRSVAGALLGADLPSSDESDTSFRCERSADLAQQGAAWCLVLRQL